MDSSTTSSPRCCTTYHAGILIPYLRLYQGIQCSNNNNNNLGLTACIFHAFCASPPTVRCLRTPWIKFMPCFDRFPCCFSCNHNSARVDVDIGVDVGPRSAQWKSAAHVQREKFMEPTTKRKYTKQKEREMRNEIDGQTDRQGD